MEPLCARLVLSGVPELTRDVNQDTLDGVSNHFVEANGSLYFAGLDGVTGHPALDWGTRETELWKTDGTAAGTGLVKDIWPGIYGSDVEVPVNVNGTVFFTADDGVHGRELWKSDGTGSGTTIVKDLTPGGQGTTFYSRVSVGDAFLFFAWPWALWRSDGTEAGTQQLRRFSTTGTAVAVGDTLYFVADDGVHGSELWRSDGTADGTVLVKDVKAGSGSSSLDGLTDVNGTLFFSAASGRELWKSDGTDAGTVLVKKYNNQFLSYGLNSFGGVAVFSFSNGELWKSDGTEAGTVLIKDVGNYAPDHFTPVGQMLYFNCYTQLFKTDGTTIGTVLVATIPSTSSYDHLTYLTDVNGILYFTARDKTHGYELWKSDGTAAGTAMVLDIRLGIYGSDPANLVNKGGVLYFAADDGTHGRELWRSDGTAEGTFLLKDINPMTAGSHDYEDSGYILTQLGDGVIFDADDGIHGAELWRTDGTPEGTQLVLDIWPGDDSSGSLELGREIACTDTVAYFPAKYGRELWKTDGTPAGTVLVKDLLPEGGSPQIEHLTNVNGTVFFAAYGELWKSDGTAVGTVQVKDIQPGPAYRQSWPGYLTDVNDTLFFMADDGVHGRELWKSDGTEGGTVLVADICSGSGSAFGSVVEADDFLFAFGGILLFSADDGVHGRELWRSDGTAQGTFLLADIYPGARGAFDTQSLRTPVEPMDGWVYFCANDGTHGFELWRTNGTPEGTMLVKDIWPGYLESFDSRNFDRRMKAVNGTLFFEATDGIHGFELWKSDGTAQGTVMVKDIQNPNLDWLYPGSAPMGMVDVNGVLYFSAEDNEHGREIWKSDGTESGTVLVADLWPGFVGSYPGPLLVWGEALYFRADDGVHGNEVWVFDTAVPNAQVVNRRIFYNNSKWDAHTGFDNGDPAANAFDDNALAPDKQALLPGTRATFANYTSYSRGINGIMIDIAGLADPAGLSVADFEFRTGNDNNPAGWPLLALDPSVITVAVRPGEGVDGSDRVTIVFPDGAVKRTWLQVTVKANDVTGLAAPDVHYWGNAIGDTGNSASDTAVNVVDALGVRANPHTLLNPAPLEDAYDFNRDKQVNVQDELIVRGNPTTLLTDLNLIDLRGDGGEGEAGGEAAGWWSVDGGESVSQRPELLPLSALALRVPLLNQSAIQWDTRQPNATLDRSPQSLLSSATTEERPEAGGGRPEAGGDGLFLSPMARYEEAGRMLERLPWRTSTQQHASTGAWTQNAVNDQSPVGPVNEEQSRSLTRRTNWAQDSPDRAKQRTLDEVLLELLADWEQF